MCLTCCTLQLFPEGCGPNLVLRGLRAQPRLRYQKAQSRPTEQFSLVGPWWRGFSLRVTLLVAEHQRQHIKLCVLGKADTHQNLFIFIWNIPNCCLTKVNKFAWIVCKYLNPCYNDNIICKEFWNVKEAFTSLLDFECELPFGTEEERAFTFKIIPFWSLIFYYKREYVLSLLLVKLNAFCKSSGRWCNLDLPIFQHLIQTLLNVINMWL